MKPIAIQKVSKGNNIVHKCQVCGKVQRNKIAKNDDFEQIINLSKKIAYGV